MNPVTATARPQTVQSLQLGPASLDDLRALAPGASFELAENEDAVVVTEPGVQPRIMREGYWLTRYEDGELTVRADRAYQKDWLTVPA